MKKRTRLGWAVGVVTPWCLGIALLVSISADAGQNATIGGSYAALNGLAVGEPGDLIPDDRAARFGHFGLDGDRPIRLAAMEAGVRDDFLRSDEIEPRRDMKRGAVRWPLVDRSRKGDPLVALRPTFDSRLRGRHGLDALRASQMIGPRDEAMPTAGFSLDDKGDPFDGAASFAPWADGEDPQNALDEPPLATSAAIAMRPAALKKRLEQGATPAISRAEALASTTPTAPDGLPVAITFTPGDVKAANASVVPRDDGRPAYAALVAGDRGARERRCLAEAIYFEARSEPESGQAAVAQVVLNRATSGLYPASICGVVYQNRTHHNRCQFSFACDGKSKRVNEPESWATAQRIADEVLDGKTYLSHVGDATHYHANYVRPGWSRRLVKMDVIGHHIFYRLRAGQT